MDKKAGMDTLPKAGMDTLPKTHDLTKEEKDFVKKLDPKHQELHKLAVEWLQTSYRPEWSHMFHEKK
jgi:hypothetical protein